MDSTLTPSRRDLLKLSAGGIGSAIFGSLAPAALPSAANVTPLAPLTFDRTWENSIHRASHIHERLGRFHHERVFSARSEISNEREALVFLGRFAGAIHSALRVELSQGDSIFNTTALAKECAETRATISKLSPEQRRSYWADIHFWRDQGCYGSNASEWDFDHGAQGKRWNEAVDRYFTKLERDLASYEKFVRHLASEATRSRELLGSLDRPIGAMGREWLDLFSRGETSALRSNPDFRALSTVARTVLPAPEYEPFNAASAHELSAAIEHLVAKGVSRVELELLGESDERHGVYSRFLNDLHSADALLDSRKVAAAPPRAFLDPLARSFDQAIALSRAPGERECSCTPTVASALSRAERILLWDWDDGYGGSDSGIAVMVRRHREGLLLEVRTLEGSGDRTTVSASRDRYSGGRFYDSINIVVTMSPTASADKGREVAHAMAEWLRVPNENVEFIPSKYQTVASVLIKGLTPRELAERLGFEGAIQSS
jgi:hypothetical protein